jgi:RNA recognition motif-containing protein
MGTKLYVGNLSFETNEGDLMRHFEKAGTVSSCHLITDKYTSKSRGFGFVEMSSPEEADKAISMFHGHELDDRALTVNIAKPREERGNSYSDGGDRRRF